ncbi:MAG: 50S ribosomal protein L17 [Deltaproteobacteria bacterium]|nr:50S ribosomal protein L17 [Deltaproteobacteria bacterium]MCX7953336.1 50S ribosomal protein L17 [Deltaproteobacteria bacterium]
MNHRKKGFKLNRTRSHRRALLRNLATSLILNGSIKTTEAKAKFLRGFVDGLFVKALRKDLHARRYLMANLFSKKAVNKVFFEWLKDVSPEKCKRSGYCKIYKLHWRPGDTADMAMVKLEV